MKADIEKLIIYYKDIQAHIRSILQLGVGPDTLLVRKAEYDCCDTIIEQLELIIKRDHEKN